jgi:hypothetical protein
MSFLFLPKKKKKKISLFFRQSDHTDQSLVPSWHARLSLRSLHFTHCRTAVPPSSESSVSSHRIKKKSHQIDRSTTDLLKSATIGAIGAETRRHLQAPDLPIPALFPKINKTITIGVVRSVCTENFAAIGRCTHPHAPGH